MESTLKDIRDGASVLDLDPKATVGGGVEDLYGEDCATEEQLVTPWTISVARSYLLFSVWDLLLCLISAFFLTVFTCFMIIFCSKSVSICFLEFSFCSFFLAQFFFSLLKLFCSQIEIEPDLGWIQKPILTC